MILTVTRTSLNPQHFLHMFVASLWIGLCVWWSWNDWWRMFSLYCTATAGRGPSGCWEQGIRNRRWPARQHWERLSSAESIQTGLSSRQEVALEWHALWLFSRSLTAFCVFKHDYLFHFEW
jgi:hypothetical protein